MNKLDDATKRQVDELSFELAGQIDSVDTGLGNQSSEGVKLTLAVMGLMASLLSRGDRDVARRLSDFYAEGFDHPESFGKSLEKAKVYAGNLAARDRILNTINFKKSMHYNPFAYIHSESTTRSPLPSAAPSRTRTSRWRGASTAISESCRLAPRTDTPF